MDAPTRPTPAPTEDRTLVDVTLNAPPTLTRDFLTVLSGIDEFLMARLIRAQTADGDTIIEFLDDVMQDRTDGFKTHHRIAAAKELIVHIIRDEQPELTAVVPAEAGTQGGGGARNTPANPAHPEPRETVIPAKAGIQGDGGRSTAANPARAEPVEGPVRTEPVLSTAEGSAHPEPNSSVVPAPTAVVPAKEGTHPRDPEPGSQRETNNSKLRTLPARRPRKRRTRTQRRRDGNARAAIRRKALASERIEEEKNEKPAPAELTIAERRIKEKLEQHWHEPDPYGAPIDSATPGRSHP